MSEQQKKAAEKLASALAAVPEGYHEDVADALVHDISVMAKTISIVEAKQ